MWNILVDELLKDGKEIHDMVEIEIVDDDYDDDVVVISEDSVKLICDEPLKENTINKRNMSFFEQNVDSEENKDNGWSNPILSNNKELNHEVVHYQSIIRKLEKCNDKNEEKNLEYELDFSFRRIAGYYSNYEYRWYNKMGHLFEEPALFYDFFYDLLRECIIQFNPTRKSHEHENDFRKAKNGVHFNQYFFGALSKRKITNLKKTSNTAAKPSILCEVCGEKVTRITEYHLRHQYDEARIRKDFKISLVSDNGKRTYDECPICGEKEVTTAHIKEHNYSEQLTVREYIDRFPNSPLSGSIRSLQEPLTTSDDGDVLTYEDIYQNTTSHKDSHSEIMLFSSHIDNVLKDDPFTSEVLKLKMMDYKDKEIAEELGETVVFELKYDISKNMKRKSEIYEYVVKNVDDLDFFDRYKGKFHIISRTKDDDREIFCVSSCAPSQVNSALKKLRKNKRKIKELFGDFKVPNV